MTPRLQAGVGVAVVGVVVGLVVLDARRGDGGDEAAYCDALDRRIDLAVVVPDSASETTADDDVLRFESDVDRLDDARLLDTLSARGPAPGGVDAEVYLEVGQADQLDDVVDAVEVLDDIGVVAILDEDAAYERFRTQFADEPLITEAIGPQDLPTSVQIAGTVDAVEALTTAVADLPAVDTVTNRRAMWAELAALLVPSADEDDLDQLVDDAPGAIRAAVSLLADANRDLPDVRPPIEPLATDAALSAAAEDLLADAADRCGLAPLDPF